MLFAQATKNRKNRRFSKIEGRWRFDNLNFARFCLIDSTIYSHRWKQLLPVVSRSLFHCISFFSSNVYSEKERTTFTEKIWGKVSWRTSNSPMKFAGKFHGPLYPTTSNAVVEAASGDIIAARRPVLRGTAFPLFTISDPRRAAERKYSITEE